jgi:hypothetical protein
MHGAGNINRQVSFKISNSSRIIISGGLQEDFQAVCLSSKELSPVQFMKKP